MKLFRFMSKEEFTKYMNGEILINNKDHNKDGNNKTTSIGFCFFRTAEYKPEEMLHSLTAIVNFEYCCVFNVPKDKVNKSWGRYSQAVNVNSFERRTIIATEYCTTQYSNKDFKLLKYAIPDWNNWKKWNWKEVK